MDIKGKDVIGLKILTLDDGRKVETVSDIVYDPTQQKVTALIVSNGGLFSWGPAGAVL